MPIKPIKKPVLVYILCFTIKYPVSKNEVQKRLLFNSNRSSEKITIALIAQSNKATKINSFTKGTKRSFPIT